MADTAAAAPADHANNVTHFSPTSATTGETPPTSRHLSDEIVLPKWGKPQILIWKDLNLRQTSDILKSGGGDNLRKCIYSILLLHDDNNKDNVLCDLYYYVLQFCIDEHFTHEQTSAFFSIVKAVHEFNKETPLDNVEQLLKYFEELIYCHSVKQPPASVLVFDADQVQRMVEFVNENYFTHYKLYKYAFTPTVRLDLRLRYDDEEERRMEKEKTAGETAQVTPGAAEPGTNDDGLQLMSTAMTADDTPLDEDNEHVRKLRTLIANEVNAQVKALEEKVLQKIEEADEAILKQFEFLRESTAPSDKSKSGGGAKEANDKKPAADKKAAKAAKGGKK